MKVGFIGIGTMGASMALNVRKAGYDVVVNDVREAAAGPHLKAGCKWANSAREVAEATDVVFTSLPGPKEVQAVAEELLAGMRKGMAWFDLSTNSPTVVRRLSERFAGMGIAMLDAPVSGGVAGAKTASLTFFIGGEKTIFERARPLLECMGKTIFYMGPPGTGQVTKLANQIAQLACLQGAAEALLFAREQGADAGKVREAVMTGLGASRMLDVLGKKMVERDFAAGIVATLHHKDIGVALELAHDAGLPLPVTAQVMQQLNALMGSGFGEQDTSSLLLVLEQMMGRTE